MASQPVAMTTTAMRPEHESFILVLLKQSKNTRRISRKNYSRADNNVNKDVQCVKLLNGKN